MEWLAGFHQRSEILDSLYTAGTISSTKKGSCNVHWRWKKLAKPKAPFRARLPTFHDFYSRLQSDVCRLQRRRRVSQLHLCPHLVLSGLHQSNGSHLLLSLSLPISCGYVYYPVGHLYDSSGSTHRMRAPALFPSPGPNLYRVAHGKWCFQLLFPPQRSKTFALESHQVFHVDGESWEVKIHPANVDGQLLVTKKKGGSHFFLLLLEMTSKPSSQMFLHLFPQVCQEACLGGILGRCTTSTPKKVRMFGISGQIRSMRLIVSNCFRTWSLYLHPSKTPGIKSTCQPLRRR